MARVIFISGGCRSGKSRFALAQAAAFPGKRYFVATCPQIDAEMDLRILRHQQERSGDGWETVEEALDLSRVFQSLRGDPEKIVVVDCLTLWVNNLLHAAGTGGGLDEAHIHAQSLALAAAAGEAFPGRVIFVSNEVGLGIVPDNTASRLFRDLLGACNQAVAARADEVYFLVSGIPLKLK